MINRNPVLYVEKTQFDGLLQERDTLLATLGYLKEQLAFSWTEQQVIEWMTANREVISQAISAGQDLGPLVRGGRLMFRDFSEESSGGGD
jgi:hypothetical protein